MAHKTLFDDFQDRLIKNTQHLQFLDVKGLVQNQSTIEVLVGRKRTLPNRFVSFESNIPLRDFALGRDFLLVNHVLPAVENIVGQLEELGTRFVSIRLLMPQAKENEEILTSTEQNRHIELRTSFLPGTQTVRYLWILRVAPL